MEFAPSQLPPEPAEDPTRKPVRLFSYRDNGQGKFEDGEWRAPLVFEVEASDILDADAAYQRATGKDVRSQPEVGCLVTPLGPKPLPRRESVMGTLSEALEAARRTPES